MTKVNETVSNYSLRDIEIMLLHCAFSSSHNGHQRFDLSNFNNGIEVNLKWHFNRRHCNLIIITFGTIVQVMWAHCTHNIRTDIMCFWCGHNKLFRIRLRSIDWNVNLLYNVQLMLSKQINIGIYACEYRMFFAYLMWFFFCCSQNTFESAVRMLIKCVLVE